MSDEFIVFEDAKPVKLTEDQQNTLMDQACQDKIRWHLMTQEARSKSLEVRQLYFDTSVEPQLFEDEDSAYEASASLKRPVMQEAVDSIHAQIHQSMYPSDERFYKGRPQNALAKDKVSIYETWTEQRLSQINFMIKTTKDELNAILDGTSAVAAPFVRKTKRRAVYRPRLRLLGINIGGMVKSYEDAVEYEATDFIPLMLQDWWVDPTVDDFEETAFIWRRWVCVDTLKSIKGFQNTDDLKPYNDCFDQDSSDKRLNFEFMGITFTSTLMDNAYDQEMAKNYVLLYEKWGDFWVDGKYYKNHVLVWSNDSTFHYFGPNEYDHGRKPFLLGPYIPMPGTLMGKSMGQDIVPLCHALNTLLNMMVDILNSNADPSYTAMIQDDVLFESVAQGKIPIGNGKYVWVKNHESLMPIKKDLSGLNIIESLMQALKDEIRESTGGVSYTTGGDPSGDPARTATETNAQVAGTSTRIQARIQNYETYKLTPYLDMTFENDRQFMSEGVMVEDFEEPLMPDEVKEMELVMQVTGSKSIMSRARDLQAMSNALLNIFPMLVQNQILTVKNGDKQLNVMAYLIHMFRLQGINLNDFLEELPQQAPGVPGIPGTDATQGGLSGLQLLQQANGGGENPPVAAA